MKNKRWRTSIIALVALLGISAPGTYVAVDSFVLPSGGNHVLTVFPLTAWSPCSQPPYRPNVLPDIQKAINRGEAVAGYWLIAPPESYRLPDTPEGRIEAGRLSAQRARYGDPNNPNDDIPAEVWDKLVFAASDTEVPGVCSPAYDIPVETVNAAMDEMRKMKCVANVSDPCLQVGYSNANEWINHVKPYGDKPWPVDTAAWVADWDGNPSFSGIRLWGGLGIDDILIKQYSGGTYYGGTTVDLDSIEVAPVIFEGVTPTPVPPTATPQPPAGILPALPPSYEASCWTSIVDPRYGDRWNQCSNAWVFPDGSYYLPDTNKHYHENGVAK